MHLKVQEQLGNYCIESIIVSIYAMVDIISWDCIIFIDVQVVRAGISRSVTWNVLSWSGGHEFEPRWVTIGVHNSSKSYLSQKYYLKCWYLYFITDTLIFLVTLLFYKFWTMHLHHNLPTEQNCPAYGWEHLQFSWETSWPPWLHQLLLTRSRLPCPTSLSSQLLSLLVIREHWLSWKVTELQRWSCWHRATHWIRLLTSTSCCRSTYTDAAWSGQRMRYTSLRNAPDVANEARRKVTTCISRYGFCYLV